MFSYFKMKRNEIKIKKMLYEAIIEIIDSQKDIIGLANRLFTALKDVPVEELKSEFINNLAVIIHEENKRNSLDDKG